MRQGRRGQGQGTGKGRGRNTQGAGYGGGGTCNCTSCDTIINHQRGKPCYSLKCPSCGSEMMRGTGIIAQENQPKENKEKEAKTTELSNKKTPVIDQNICRGCMICARHCPEGAIQRINGFAVINSKVCTNCRNCVAGCPLEAIN